MKDPGDMVHGFERVVNRWKAMISLSSDHAGIDAELGVLQDDMHHVLARLTDARDVRDYIWAMRKASENWLASNPHKAPWDK